MTQRGHSGKFSCLRDIHVVGVDAIIVAHFVRKPEDERLISHDERLNRGTRPLIARQLSNFVETRTMSQKINVKSKHAKQFAV